MNKTAETVLITAGPTREKIDAVRFLSNRSSGKMGYALAQAAAEAGFRVVLVSGPTALTPPEGVELIDVESAAEMARAVHRLAPSARLIIMAAAVAVLLLTIREPRLSAENQALEAKHPEWNLAEDDGSGHEVLPKPVKRSLGFLLASIALWYIGYNGVTTWFTTYISEIMGEGLGTASRCLLVATAGAIVSYIPIGAVASKVGRRKTILTGCALLAACFFTGFLLTTAFSTLNFAMYIVFALVGLAWAAINVNSLPMVVEMCRGSDIGKFTGYYYTASMAAQVVTPVLAGTLMRHVSYKILFPYAALFVALSFLTMCFVRHGDSKAEAKRGLDAFEEMD